MADPVGVQFEVHIIGDETGELFPGKFRAKEKLSWNDQLNIDRMRRELLGVNAAEALADVYQRATIIAELSARLTEFPDFWKNSRGGLDLVDDNVVLEVYKAAQDIREKWLTSQKEKGEVAKKKLTEKQGGAK
jgi:hypothetical protein